MKFNKLTNEIEGCNAIGAASTIDTTKHFIRKLKTNEIQEFDFLSNGELGKVNRSKSDIKNECEEFKQSFSVSINSFQEQEKVLEIYKMKFKVSPIYKKYAASFTFVENSGMIEHTPSKSDDYHYSFYKTDDFNVTTALRDITIIDLSEACK